MNQLIQQLDLANVLFVSPQNVTHHLKTASQRGVSNSTSKGQVVMGKVKPPRVGL